jgi:hypothetical protein
MCSYGLGHLSFYNHFHSDIFVCQNGYDLKYSDDQIVYDDRNRYYSSQLHSDIVACSNHCTNHLDVKTFSNDLDRCFDRKRNETISNRSSFMNVSIFETTITTTTTINKLQSEEIHLPITFCSITTRWFVRITIS